MVNSTRGADLARDGEGILVGPGFNAQSLGILVVCQPSPSGSLDGGGLGVKLRLEFLEAAEVARQIGSQSSFDWSGVLRRPKIAETTTQFLCLRRTKVFPEYAVVDMAPSIEADRIVKGYNCLDIVLGFSFCLLLQRCV